MRYLTLLLLFAACTAAELPELANRPGQPFDVGADFPSRVVYEQTGALVIPYIFTNYDAQHNTYDVGCWHFASDSTRGMHWKVWAETIPAQSESPYSHAINATAPYSEVDTLYWRWWEANPF